MRIKSSFYAKFHHHLSYAQCAQIGEMWKKLITRPIFGVNRCLRACWNRIIKMLSLKTNMKFFRIQDGRHIQNGRRYYIDNNDTLICHSNLTSPIQTKCGKNILLDLRNMPAEEFFIFLKIQDGRRRSKVKNWPNLTPQITFRLIIWLPFVRFGQNLVWTFYLTLETCLRKNFSFFSKVKMAAVG